MKNNYYMPRIENTPRARHLTTLHTGRILPMVVVSALLVGGLIYAVALRAETVQDQYRVQQLMRLRQQLQRERQRLEQERAYYRSPHVLEPLARRLGLVRPSASQIIVAGADGGFPQRSPAMSSGSQGAPIKAVDELTRMQNAHRRSKQSRTVRAGAESKPVVSAPLKRPRWVDSVGGRGTISELAPESRTSAQTELLPATGWSRSESHPSAERVGHASTAEQR
ncbi:MAG: hypothetical protein RMM98_00570 [Acidobacteriota bacterium]|nr:hypothetical protein [Blastocatellia bacterium]MDW8238082.1 hypothetical protein [Acidobacteriota bacterium]